MEFCAALHFLELANTQYRTHITDTFMMSGSVEPFVNLPRKPLTFHGQLQDKTSLMSKTNNILTCAQALINKNLIPPSIWHTHYL